MAQEVKLSEKEIQQLNIRYRALEELENNLFIHKNELSYFVKNFLETKKLDIKLDWQIDIGKGIIYVKEKENGNNDNSDKS